jgi:hypothetical protein
MSLRHICPGVSAGPGGVRQAPQTAAATRKPISAIAPGTSRTSLKPQEGNLRRRRWLEVSSSVDQKSFKLDFVPAISNARQTRCLDEERKPQIVDVRGILDFRVIVNSSPT